MKLKVVMKDKTWFVIKDGEFWNGMLKGKDVYDRQMFFPMTSVLYYEELTDED